MLARGLYVAGIYNATAMHDQMALLAQYPERLRANCSSDGWVGIERRQDCRFNRTSVAEVLLQLKQGTKRKGRVEVVTRKFFQRELRLN
jgi:hypothetical protein